MTRRKSLQIKVGDVKIGGGAPVAIQSMTKTDTRDVRATVRQIKALLRQGCELVRVAVPDEAAALAIRQIKSKVEIPIVADIHFNYRLALTAIKCGADKIRLNPGNIYRREEVEAVVKAALVRKVPIRVGVNSGSVWVPEVVRRLSLRGQSPKPAALPLGRQSRGLLRPFRARNDGYRTASPARGVRERPIHNSLVGSALAYVRMLESMDFYDIIISLKASDVSSTIAAYREMAGRCQYPLHLGVTATGLPHDGIIKSAIGIGTLLAEGIGDTIRVSLTGDPCEEVRVAQDILQSLGLRRFHPEIVSCPTCGRCEVDLRGIAQEVEEKVAKRSISPLRIAIMGCVVNGPGEAREADLGIACGRGAGVLFKKGRRIRTVKERDMVEALINEIG